MLITGIRRKLDVESDERKSALFTRYLIHYSRMFAYIGFIISILIGVDYFCIPKTQSEIIANRYYQVTDNLNRTEYHFFTASHHFLSDAVFYEYTNIGDEVTIYYTPIFKTITDVSHRINRSVYACKPHNIYGWLLIVVGLTFVCSLIVIVRTWNWVKKRVYVKYDSVVNLGIINCILCIITLIAVLFHFLY